MKHWKTIEKEIGVGNRGEQRLSKGNFHMVTTRSPFSASWNITGLKVSLLYCEKRGTNTSNLPERSFLDLLWKNRNEFRSNLFVFPSPYSRFFFYREVQLPQRSGRSLIYPWFLFLVCYTGCPSNRRTIGNRVILHKRSANNNK